ncbi:AbiH family protein [Streptococcus gallolyticus]|uniref:Uncharacterized protein n=1 Tax=Streptococcus gallolyticus TaxID=315405 RepID=A0A139R3G4_9STRE|nr:AbiH family protein [Streptococcus gallolyticus]KXT67520.1 hypothetical protein SGADD02_01366 [Streptococcus gallolyticus]KXU09322.1 hypothetical protein SGADD03_00878 [Streptococcus gallolyticus]
MNITYLVGNGLDLQFKLNTRYKDFYKYQLSLYEDKKEKTGYSNFIYANLFSDKDNGYENWADFELSIGNLTKTKSEITSSEQSKDKFIDDFADIVDDLRDYLKIIEESFDSEKYVIDFINTLNGLVTDLPRTNQARIRQMFRDNYHSDDKVTILTLNYTNTIDSLYEQSEKVFSNSFKDNNYKFRIEPPIHAHGSLGFCTILGVSDEDQISGDFSDEQKESLVKGLALSSFREDMDERNSQVISTSDIFIIYGLSLGETDKYIWNQLAKQSINRKIPIIIYDYNPEFDPGNPTRIKRMYKRVETKFIKNSGIDKELEEQLRKQLIPVIGKSIFELKEK